MPRKITLKYYFCVEGETEQWYLNWLKDTINNINQSKYKISIDCKVEKSPLKRIKSLVITDKTDIWYLSDYETESTNQFEKVIDEFKKVEKTGKQVSCKLGYSNLSFDLWIILHKSDCNKEFSQVKNYLSLINRTYNEHFDSMREYKEERNFKRCLNKLTFSDVKDAINRSKKIMENIQNNMYNAIKYKGYEYYKENPSLTVWEAVEKILKDCELI